MEALIAGQPFDISLIALQVLQCGHLMAITGGRYFLLLLSQLPSICSYYCHCRSQVSQISIVVLNPDLFCSFGSEINLKCNILFGSEVPAN